LEQHFGARQKAKKHQAAFAGCHFGVRKEKADQDSPAGLRLAEGCWSAWVSRARCGL